MKISEKRRRKMLSNTDAPKKSCDKVSDRRRFGSIGYLFATVLLFALTSLTKDDAHTQTVGRAEDNTQKQQSRGLMVGKTASE